MTPRKIIALTRWTFVGKVTFLLFNMLSRLVIAFLPRSKHLLISCLQSSSVILEPPKIKSPTISPSICHEVMGPDAIILVFWILSFKPTFSLYSFTFTKRLFNSSLLSAIRVVSSEYLRLYIYLPEILIPACGQTSLAFRMMYFAYRASLVAQKLKRLPPVQETQVRSLGWEDPMEKEMVTHSRILSWRILWMEEPGRL